MAHIPQKVSYVGEAQLHWPRTPSSGWANTKRQASSVEVDLRWSTCSSSESRPFVFCLPCYAIDLILRFCSQGIKELRPPKSGTAGLVLILSRWHDSRTDERREDRDLSPWHPQGWLHSSPAQFDVLSEMVFVHSLWRSSGSRTVAATPPSFMYDLICILQFNRSVSSSSLLSIDHIGFV